MTFSIETLPNLHADVRAILAVAEIGFVVVFTLEYLLRCCAARRVQDYVFSFYGLIDLLAIAPFYLMLTGELLEGVGWFVTGRFSGMELQGVRVLRLVRAFRLLKLARYNAAMGRFRRAFRSIREELILTGTVTGCVVFFAAVMVYHFEHQAQPEAFASIFHALWWAVVTLTTVGYGDVYPVTAGGRVFTGFLLIAGLGLIAVPSGLIASALTATRRETDEPSPPAG